MPCNCGNPNCPNAQRTAGMVGYPPTDPGPVGPDSPLENIQARGYYRGWLQGNTGNPLDVAGPGNLPADKYAAFTESWKQGFTQGVADIGTGTRVCSVENIQNALIAGGADITADGDWGKETQAAFDAAGLTCAQLVPSCTTCPGSYTPGTGTTPGTTHPGTGTTPVVGTAPPAAPKAAVWPWIVGGVALAGAVGYALMATPSTPKRNPVSARGKDNSFGRGYYPMPARLSHLGNFCAALRPSKLVDHKVYPDEPMSPPDSLRKTGPFRDFYNTTPRSRVRVDLLRAKVDSRFSILERDLESLISLGLVRIQQNEPGTLDFYFEGPQ